MQIFLMLKIKVDRLKFNNCIVIFKPKETNPMLSLAVVKLIFKNNKIETLKYELV